MGTGKDWVRSAIIDLHYFTAAVWKRCPRIGPFSASIKVVHNGVMRTEAKMVRQSVSLPVKVATQVRSMAKSRRLSATRMLVELIENGIAAEQRKQQAFFDLAERFRSETDPEAAKRLGDELGQMVFGG